MLQLTFNSYFPIGGGKHGQDYGLLEDLFNVASDAVSKIKPFVKAIDKTGGLDNIVDLAKPFMDALSGILGGGGSDDDKETKKTPKKETPKVVKKVVEPEPEPEPEYEER